MMQASEKTKNIVNELTAILTRKSSLKNTEIQKEVGLTSQEISYGLNYMLQHRLVSREGLNKGTRWSLSTGGQVEAESNNGHHVGLVKPTTVEISKSCLKLLVRDIVDRGEPLEGPLQQAVMKALLVLV